MLEVLVSALEIMQDESSFSIEVSWTKTKIQAVGVNDPPVSVQIVWNGVVVDKFTYLGVLVPNTGSSEHEISRWIAMTRDCVHALQRRIWQSTIGLDIKIKLSNAYVLPVLLYVAETWYLDTHQHSGKKLNALHLWNGA